MMFRGLLVESVDPNATLLPNIEDMAGILTENCLNGCLKGIQHIQRDEGLNRTGEAAAVDTVGIWTKIP